MYLVGKGESLMVIMKEADFRKEIKSAPDKAYLFFGDEDYMKIFALKTATESVSPDPSLAFFNEIRLDSFTYSPDALLDALMPLPMMTDRKLVIISGLDIGAMKPPEVESLCATLDQLDEYDYNTVIINVAADRLDPGILPKRPSSLLKKLGEHAKLVNFEKNTPHRLAAWVGKHFEHNGVFASPEVCAYVVERCGRDMFALASETDKLSFYVLSADRTEVLKNDVELVAVPAAEYDAFAFTNAIAAGRKEEALNILADLKLRKTDPIIIMSEITKTACDMLAISSLRDDGLTAGEMSGALRMHEYKVSVMLRSCPRVEMCKAMVRRCRDADLELKSSREGYAVLEKLICVI